MCDSEKYKAIKKANRRENLIIAIELAISIPLMYVLLYIIKSLGLWRIYM